MLAQALFAAEDEHVVERDEALVAKHAVLGADDVPSDVELFSTVCALPFLNHAEQSGQRA